MTIHNSSCWRITENEHPCEWREPPTFTSAGDSGNETGHLAEIADFLAAIREGRSTRSAIHESYKSMVLYEAIAESAATERAVPMVYEALPRSACDSNRPGRPDWRDLIRPGRSPRKRTAPLRVRGAVFVARHPERLVTLRATREGE